MYVLHIQKEISNRQNYVSPIRHPPTVSESQCDLGALREKAKALREEKKRLQQVLEETNQRAEGEKEQKEQAENNVQALLQSMPEVNGCINWKYS